MRSAGGLELGLPQKTPPVSCLVLRYYVMQNDQFITVIFFFKVWPIQTTARENKKNGLFSQNDHHIA